MTDDERAEEQASTAEVDPEVEATGEAPGVPAEQRGAADEDRTPEPQPLGERHGGVGSAAAGGVLESPGGPGTISQQDEEEGERETTLVQQLAQEETIGEISPEMGEKEADPEAGGRRFDELVAKRQRAGLTDAEADELGRLMAEREGREWTSTRSVKAEFQPDTA